MEGGNLAAAEVGLLYVLLLVTTKRVSATAPVNSPFVKGVKRFRSQQVNEYHALWSASDKHLIRLTKSGSSTVASTSRRYRSQPLPSFLILTLMNLATTMERTAVLCWRIPDICKQLYDFLVMALQILSKIERSLFVSPRSAAEVYSGPSHSIPWSTSSSRRRLLSKPV